MEAFEMRSAMTYMVAIEDGEIVKMTDNGLESTGMYLVSPVAVPTTYEAISKNQWVVANA
jgi:hypothetical protein